MRDTVYWLDRRTIGETGGNRYPQKVSLTHDPIPDATTVTLEEYRKGKRPWPTSTSP